MTVELQLWILWLDTSARKMFGFLWPVLQELIGHWPSKIVIQFFAGMNQEHKEQTAGMWFAPDILSHNSSKLQGEIERSMGTRCGDGSMDGEIIKLNRLPDIPAASSEIHFKYF